ncbi:hypothetical protein T459_09618 [Capsicum annuum]|uniref:Uncharacterized protein n=1 Tax=Capsicum annuum TaxID=4072 RepID=A0A2G2ZZV6_CAPAN|nr:hypothetical protein T459_09618 [Capsicum annuum]
MLLFSGFRGPDDKHATIGAMVELQYEILIAKLKRPARCTDLSLIRKASSSTCSAYNRASLFESVWKHDRYFGSKQLLLKGRSSDLEDDIDLLAPFVGLDRNQISYHMKFHVLILERELLLAVPALLFHQILEL